MATMSNAANHRLSPSTVTNIRRLVWGEDVKLDVFLRWTQEFTFSKEEPSALVQLDGGPCAVIAPLQAYVLKSLIFDSPKENWRNITEEEQKQHFCLALCDALTKVKSGDSFYVVYKSSSEKDGGNTSEDNRSGSHDSDEGGSSPKKRKLNDEEFHEELRYEACETSEDLQKCVADHGSDYLNQYGVLLALYSIVLTKGIDQIKNEVEDPSEPLIDPVHGHGSQSLINLFLTGRAVTNVWDNDKDVSGLKLHGVNKRATIGFMTLLEHLRYCEVGWYLKNPEFPLWLLGSETHLTVLFLLDRNLVGHESPDAAARRAFGAYDKEGSGFIQTDKLGELLQSLELVSEPEYVKIMADKLDPEQLGIITLNGFMEEFFPSSGANTAFTFSLYHYNGLQRSGKDNKVQYADGEAMIMEHPEVQIITDTSAIKTCLMTKWPTIELKWKDNYIPSMN